MEVFNRPCNREYHAIAVLRMRSVEVQKNIIFDWRFSKKEGTRIKCGTKDACVEEGTDDS